MKKKILKVFKYFLTNYWTVICRIFVHAIRIGQKKLRGEIISDFPAFFTVSTILRREYLTSNYRSFKFDKCWCSYKKKNSRVEMTKDKKNISLGKFLIILINLVPNAWLNFLILFVLASSDNLARFSCWQENFLKDLSKKSFFFPLWRNEKSKE